MSFKPDDKEHEINTIDALSVIADQLILLNDKMEQHLRFGAPSYLTGVNGQLVGVNDSGELSVTPGPYDLAVFNELDQPNTAYNFYIPNGQLQFILTGFLAYGDKQVSSSTNATVVIYETSEVDSTTEDRVLIQFELGQNQSVPFPNVRILANRGVYINAKTDDDDIHMTIFGHYVNLNGRRPVDFT